MREWWYGDEPNLPIDIGLKGPFKSEAAAKTALEICFPNKGSRVKVYQWSAIGVELRTAIRRAGKAPPDDGEYQRARLREARAAGGNHAVSGSED